MLTGDACTCAHTTARVHSAPQPLATSQHPGTSTHCTIEYPRSPTKAMAVSQGCQVSMGSVLVPVCPNVSV